MSKVKYGFSCSNCMTFREVELFEALEWTKCPNCNIEITDISDDVFWECDCEAHNDYDAPKCWSCGSEK